MAPTGAACLANRKASVIVRRNAVTVGMWPGPRRGLRVGGGMSGRKLPVWACVGEALLFAPKAWGAAWGALVLIAVAEAVPLALGADGGLRGREWMAAPLGLAAWAVGLIVDGALYRLGVFGREARREGLGFAGLQFGRPELRLLAAQLLIGLFLVLIAVAAIVVLAISLTAAGLAEVDVDKVKTLADLRAFAGPVELGVIGALIVGIAAIFLLLSVRFSLYGAATLGRRRIVSLDAMGLAEGAFWPLLFGLVLVSLPSILLFAWQAGAAAPEGQALLMFQGLQALAYAFVQKPLAAGFLSAAYRRLEYLPAEIEGN